MLVSALCMMACCGSGLGYLMFILSHPVLLGPKQCEQQCSLLSGCRNYNYHITLRCYLDPAVTHVSGAYRFRLTKTLKTTAKCPQNHWFMKTVRGYICIQGFRGLPALRYERETRIENTIMAAVSIGNGNRTVVLLFTMGSGFVYTYRPLFGRDIRLLVFYNQSRNVVFATEEELFAHNLASEISTSLRQNIRCSALAVSADGTIFFAVDSTLFSISMVGTNCEPCFHAHFPPTFIAITSTGNVIAGCSTKVILKAVNGTHLFTLFDQPSIDMCYDDRDSLFVISVTYDVKKLYRISVTSAVKHIFLEDINVKQMFIFDKKLYGEFPKPSYPYFWRIGFSAEHKVKVIHANYSSTDVKRHGSWKTAWYIP